MAAKITWNRKGFRELLTGPEAQAEIDSRAERMVAACGDGFESPPAQRPRNRARRIVVTTTFEARRKNAAQNTMLRNLPYGG